MSKRKAQKKEKPASPAAPPAAPRDGVQLIIAGAGVLVTGMLLFGGQGGDGLPYCSAGSGCEIVQNSSWSRPLGLPLALLGMLTYLALAAAASIRKPSSRRRLIAFLATSGFVISVYLTLISGLVIGAYCVYCLISLALMTLAFVFSLIGRARIGTGALRVTGLVAGLAVAAVMHGAATGHIGSGMAADEELRALAEHLDARGAKFYGASWCPHCQDQKKLFGAAAPYLPYVECAPNGPRAVRATVCEVREIRQYPTWIIDGRRIERLMPINDLKTVSGFVFSRSSAGGS